MELDAVALSTLMTCTDEVVDTYEALPRNRRAARAAASLVTAPPAAEQFAIGTPDRTSKRARYQSPDERGAADTVAIEDSPPPSPARGYG